ncbi:hypothetical protein SAMN04487977_101512 [Treponema bryantii]|uniref:Uncharacterized protein n=1 Tax=Treponema bryantii TaxID=163 RepID=A0A1H9AY22_9SPIR|nr:hypothetical protein SAMN04487977_101512 [Treponema bryantii]
MIKILYAVLSIALFPIIVIVLGVYMWITCFIDFMKE